jgi:hypothetical protein
VTLANILKCFLIRLVYHIPCVLSFVSHLAVWDTFFETRWLWGNLLLAGGCCMCENKGCTEDLIQSVCTCHCDAHPFYILFCDLLCCIVDVLCLWYVVLYFNSLILNHVTFWSIIWFIVWFSVSLCHVVHLLLILDLTVMTVFYIVSNTCVSRYSQNSASSFCFSQVTTLCVNTHTLSLSHTHARMLIHAHTIFWYCHTTVKSDNLTFKANLMTMFTFVNSLPYWWFNIHVTFPRPGGQI